MRIPFGRAIFIIFQREIFYEIRSRQRLFIIVLYAALSTFAFSFALEFDRIVRQEVIAGVLWTTIIFASLVGFERQSGEANRSGLREALRLAPLSRQAILFGHILGNWLITLALAFVTLLVQSWLFDVWLLELPIIITVGMGSLGIVTIGTTLSAMVSQVRARAGILGMLMLPLILPILISSVRFTVAARANLPVQDEWICMLILQDFILLILASLLYPHLEDE